MDIRPGATLRKLPEPTRRLRTVAGVPALKKSTREIKRPCSNRSKAKSPVQDMAAEITAPCAGSQQPRTTLRGKAYHITYQRPITAKLNFIFWGQRSVGFLNAPPVDLNGGPRFKGLMGRESQRSFSSVLLPKRHSVVAHYLPDQVSSPSAAAHIGQAGRLHSL